MKMILEEMNELSFYRNMETNTHESPLHIVKLKEVETIFINFKKTLTSEPTNIWIDEDSFKKMTNEKY